VSGIGKIREYIVNNKDFLQTTSSILLGVAGLMVAYQAYKVGSRQVLIMEAEQAPIITIEPSIKSGIFNLKVDNIGGPIKNLELRHRDVLWLYVDMYPYLSPPKMRSYYNRALNGEKVNLERFVGGRTNIIVQGFAEKIELTGLPKGTLAVVSDNRSIKNLVKRDAEFNKESRLIGKNVESASLQLATCLEIKYVNVFGKNKTEYYCTFIKSFSANPEAEPFRSVDESSTSYFFRNMGSNLDYNVSVNSNSLYDIYNKSIVNPKIIMFLQGGGNKLDGYVSFYRKSPYF
jgi:hypothetical protein